MGVDSHAKIVTFADGSAIRYQKLISKLPLDIMLKWCGKEALGKRLTYSSTHIIGLGLR
jgi:hypothetical protein